MKVEVVYALPDAQGCYLSTQVPDNTTITQALDFICFFDLFPEVNFTKNQLGVFGKIVSHDYILAEGDRIEIYRPVYFDPKVGRQENHRANTRQSKPKKYRK